MASIRFGAATLSVPWDPRQATLSQDFVEREYRVLMPYSSVPELIEPAVRRFYRMIYREGARHLDRLALHLVQAWETGAWAGSAAQLPSAAAAATASATGPRYGAPADPRGYAAALLAWTQAFVYERNPKGSDVVAPIAAAFQSRGDCDSRAIVIAMLLKREGIDAAMMVSLVHNHALLAADVPGSGARFPYLDKRWLVAETTAKVALGLIDQTQSNIEDWFGVDFPY